MTKIFEYNLEGCKSDTSFNDEFIYHLLMHGHKGLMNMTLDELEAELKQCQYEGDDTSPYKLDEMPDNIEATVGLYFEDEWQHAETKRDVMQYMGRELIRLGIDDGGATANAIDKLEETGAFQEIDYFDYIEGLLNDAGYYTYNSDNWFEIYENYEGGE
jgi:hypothetical protein